MIVHRVLLMHFLRGDYTERLGAPFVMPFSKTLHDSQCLLGFCACTLSNVMKVVVLGACM